MRSLMSTVLACAFSFSGVVLFAQQPHTSTASAHPGAKAHAAVDPEASPLLPAAMSARQQRMARNWRRHEEARDWRAARNSCRSQATSTAARRHTGRSRSL